MDKIKSGIRTSEFWLGAFGALLIFFNEYFELGIDTAGVLSMSGVIISYIIGRSKVKSL